MNLAAEVVPTARATPQKTHNTEEKMNWIKKWKRRTLIKLEEDARRNAMIKDTLTLMKGGSSEQNSTKGGRSEKG